MKIQGFWSIIFINFIWLRHNNDKFIREIIHKKDRSAYGVLAGIVGIICNVFLFAGKLIIGLLINSSAVMTDSFNNLSDAASSVISLVGAKLAAKPADKEHPFGHGRYEYIVALIVSFIILEVYRQDLSSRRSEYLTDSPDHTYCFCFCENLAVTV